MPTNTVDMPKDITRRFWLTVKTPADAKPGAVPGQGHDQAGEGRRGRGARRVHASAPARSTRWTSRPARGATRSASPGTATTRPRPRSTEQMSLKSLRKMREYGFTTFSGMPVVAYQGFKDGKPVLDFSVGRRADEAGQGAGLPGRWSPTAAAFNGFDAYYQDTERDEGRRASRTTASSSRPSTPRSRSTPTQHGWLPGLLQPRRRADRRRPDPLGRERRGLPQGVPQGAAVLHRGQQLRGQRPQRPALPPGQGPARRRLERPRRGVGQPAPRGRQRLGLLQRRQPLDLRRSTCTRPPSSSA